VNDIEMMHVALDAARTALASQDIPVGAAIFNKAGVLIATGHNQRELHNDPTAHAEIVAIRNAAEKLGDWHLTDHTLVVTLEPCVMCAGAIYCAILEVPLELKSVQVFWLKNVEN
jgi:tRNA(adenine34) deaminase